MTMLKTYEITCRGHALAAGIRAASPAWALETWKAALSPEAYSLHRTPAPRGVEEYESDPFEGIVAVEVTPVAQFAQEEFEESCA